MEPTLTPPVGIFLRGLRSDQGRDSLIKPHGKYTKKTSFRRTFLLDEIDTFHINNTLRIAWLFSLQNTSLNWSRDSKVSENIMPC